MAHNDSVFLYEISPVAGGFKNTMSRRPGHGHVERHGSKIRLVVTTAGILIGTVSVKTTPHGRTAPHTRTSKNFFGFDNCIGGLRGNKLSHSQSLANDAHRLSKLTEIPATGFRQNDATVLQLLAPEQAAVAWLEPAQQHKKHYTMFDLYFGKNHWAQIPSDIGDVIINQKKRGDFFQIAFKKLGSKENMEYSLDELLRIIKSENFMTLDEEGKEAIIGQSPALFDDYYAHYAGPEYAEKDEEESDITLLDLVMLLVNNKAHTAGKEIPATLREAFAVIKSTVSADNPGRHPRNRGEKIKKRIVNSLPIERRMVSSSQHYDSQQCAKDGNGVTNNHQHRKTSSALLSRPYSNIWHPEGSHRIVQSVIDRDKRKLVQLVHYRTNHKTKDWVLRYRKNQPCEKDDAGLYECLKLKSVYVDPTDSRLIIQTLDVKANDLGDREIERIEDIVFRNVDMREKSTKIYRSWIQHESSRWRDEEEEQGILPEIPAFHDKNRLELLSKILEQSSAAAARTEVTESNTKLKHSSSDSNPDRTNPITQKRARHFKTVTIDYCVFHGWSTTANTNRRLQSWIILRRLFNPHANGESDPQVKISLHWAFEGNTITNTYVNPTGYVNLISENIIATGGIVNGMNQVNGINERTRSITTIIPPPLGEYVSLSSLENLGKQYHEYGNYLTKREEVDLIIQEWQDGSMMLVP